MAKDIEEIYQRNQKRYHSSLATAKKTDNRLVYYRSLLALIIIGLLIYGAFQDVTGMYWVAALLVLFFMLLVSKHQKVRKEITHLDNLRQINEQAIRRLSHQWSDFPRTGERFLLSEHPYSGDLNIFGQGSLFQYINATNLETGEEALARLLSEPTNLKDIRARQTALQELAPRLDWRQQLQAIGMGSQYKAGELKKLWLWAKEKSPLWQSQAIYLLALLPITTWLLFILMAWQWVPTYIPLTLFLLQALLVTVGQVFVSQAFGDTERAAAELARLSRLLTHIEGQQFQSPLLVELQRRLLRDDKSASQQVKALSKIAVLINLRYSVVYHFVNALFFCDLYTIRALEQWKRQYGMYLEDWFRVIGQFEALASLAALAHDQPHWVFPEVKEAKPFLVAVNLGHPLIKPATRVCNDVALPRSGTVHIITGSNMSGKSTLLRTVGINLVLAYAGAPVCASELRCSLMHIYTSMRVQDSLEESVSSFYAELKRIKLVIEAARRGSPLIFLLDEIFKGTNSRDRIAGARTVIKNLARQEVIGFVTTHDLELGSLEKENPAQIQNYHFSDEIINQTITFDYRLKKGISQTTNALALMKMVGIEV
ncbi:MutS family DNA mismatch repair protein [Desulforamulus ferrireducens]|uniref:DNA mismatch repair protein MutS n=1 Tax=Desulforamulus ferrireducens TaxID=1833852 RepID=A0A1S6IZ09_9FIRM|nr:MutS family DNA mismatch repair protein [Desulforamulus ferrireducens]AQS60008.1 DNA mismatch repair protein MutS [Desulforamulus ferrireducens]